MAKSIIEVSNYIVVDYGQPFNLLAFPKTSVYSETANSFELRVRPREDVIEIQFSEVGDWYTDATHTTAFTVETLRTFLREFTTGRIRRGDNIRVLYRDRVLALGGIVEALECIPEKTGASFLLSPSGYSDGKVHAALPEDGSGDMDFSRLSGATRTNAQGNIEEVSTLGDELVTNGTFETILGNELVTNGGFDSDSDWVKQSGWSIEEDEGGNNVASNDGTAGSIYQDTSNLIAGKSYKVSIEITNYVSGDIRVELGGFCTTCGSTFSGDGVKEFIYTIPSGTSPLNRRLIRSLSFQGSIDNISVKEVVQDNWTLGTGWSIEDGVVNSTQSGNFTQTTTTNLSIGSQITMSFDILNYTSGEARMYADGTDVGVSIYHSGNGTYTRTLNVTSSVQTFGVRSHGSNALIGSIDNISVKEVIEEGIPRLNYDDIEYQDVLGAELVSNGDFSNGLNGWGAGSGANLSVDNGVLTISGDNDFNTFARTSDSNLEIGKTYRISLDINSGTTSQFRLSIFGNGLPLVVSPIESKVYTADITIINTTNFIDIINFTDDGVNDTLLIDNISVKEILGQEVVSSGCPSLLLEPASTNLITDSEGFSDNSWLKAESTVIANSTIAPDGTLTAETLIPNVSGNLTTAGNASTNNRIFFILGSQLSTSSHSIYVKSVSGLEFNFSLYVQSNDSIKAINTVTVTNEWQRVEVSAINAIGINRLTICTEEDVYMWGAQLEALPYATSYIPTNGSIATRLAETLERDNISHLINSEEGVLYVEMKKGDGTLRISLNNGSSTNRMFFEFNTTTNIVWWYTSYGGQINSKILANLSDTTELNKCAFMWGNNNFKMYQNGQLLYEDLTVTGMLPNKLSKLSFSGATGTLPFYGEIKDVRIYKSIAEAQKDLTYIN